jgi:hypothetical protein
LKAADEGLDLKELYRLVAFEDPEVTSLVGSHPELRNSIYQSLVGFLSYAKWERQQRHT